MTLEELLNKCIQRGWKPFNVDCDWTDVEVINRLNDNRYIPEHSEIIFKTDTHRHVFDCDIRDLVSKSSGLWQFVCKNKMVKKLGDNFKYFYNSRDNKSSLRYYEDRYKYWLLESALKDESELESFILDNIKVEGL